MKRKVITLCGSTRFMKKIIEINEKLELEGNIVFGFVQRTKEEEYNLKEIEILDAVHRYKIDLSDEIFVVNVDGYIGESTSNEIEYAKHKSKVIKYLV